MVSQQFAKSPPLPSGRDTLCSPVERAEDVTAEEIAARGYSIDGAAHFRLAGTFAGLAPINAASMDLRGEVSLVWPMIVALARLPLMGNRGDGSTLTARMLLAAWECGRRSAQPCSCTQEVNHG